jgi:hypothetical protein
MEPLAAACTALAALLAATIAVAVYIGVLHLRLRSRVASNACIAYDPEKAEAPEFAPEPTKGNSSDPAMAPCSPNGHSQKGKHEAVKLDLTPGTRQQLGASLRELLAAEVGEGLQAGLGARLDALERQVRDALERSSARPLPPAGAPPVMPPAPPIAVQPQVKVCSAGAQTVAPISTADRSIGVQEELGASGNGTKSRELAFGPTGRSRPGALPEIPKRIPSSSPEAKALKTNLADLRRNLLEKDKETTSLQKQLKQCRQAVWDQTKDQKASDFQLRQMLMDPQNVSKAQAEDIQKLALEVDRLSGSLSETKSQEVYWMTIAQRQRAFFQQNEHMMMQEGSHDSMVQGLFKKHPAGEVFLPPPQLPGDAAYGWDGQQTEGRPKRSRTSGPRASLDYDEDDAGTDDEMLDYEDGLTGSSGHSFGGLAGLPSLPLPHAGEDEGMTLPSMPSSDTARSL